MHTHWRTLYQIYSHPIAANYDLPPPLVSPTLLPRSRRYDPLTNSNVSRLCRVCTDIHPRWKMTRVLRKRGGKVGKQAPGYGGRGFPFVSHLDREWNFARPMLRSPWNIVRYPIIKIITLPLCNSIRSAYLEMNLVCFFFFFYYYWTNRRGWKLWEASLVKFWFGILFFFFFFRWRVIQINFSCCLSKWGEEKLLRKLGRKFWLTLEKCERSRSVYQRSSH